MNNCITSKYSWLRKGKHLIQRIVAPQEETVPEHGGRAHLKLESESAVRLQRTEIKAGLITLQSKEM